MIKKIFILICLVVAVQQLQAQVVEIKPERPQRGQKVTITYHTGAANAVIGKDAAPVFLVFTFSRFYELPNKVPMVKKGQDWVLSFVLQRYATFASFYFESGKITDKLAADKDYSFAVYNGSKRVRDSYLHESYSISTQMPKSPKIHPLEVELLQKELVGYPDNYEAKVRLQSVKMEMAKTPAEKLKYRNEARRIIAAKFEENPTKGDNMNHVTMGYLIIGENSRLDSIRNVVLQRFPESDLAKDYKVSAIAKEKDTPKKIAQLEAMLKDQDKTGEGWAKDIHGILFKHYTSTGDAAKAVEHARKSIGETNPRSPEELKDIAARLTVHKLAPDTAIAYAKQSLKMADQWPVGVIRYFPQYGYILPYAADSTKTRTIAEAKSDLFSILALNELYLGDRSSALNYAAQSEKESLNKESSMNIAAVYEQTDKPEKAYNALWEVLLKDPSDTTMIKSAKINFLKFNPSEAEFNKRLKKLEDLKIAQVRATLQKQLLGKPGPELKGIVDLTGKSVNMDLFKGKIVVIDFWATWCIPCMEELPYLQKVYDQYKDNPNVVFMVVNSGARNTIDDAIGWTKKNKQYTFPIYFNNDSNIGEKVGFTVIPTVIVLDQKGLMQFKTVGFEGAEMEMKLDQEIKILLGK